MRRACLQIIRETDATWVDDPVSGDQPIGPSAAAPAQVHLDAAEQDERQASSAGRVSVSHVNTMYRNT
jgi:hypothetical protein